MLRLCKRLALLAGVALCLGDLWGRRLPVPESKKTPQESKTLRTDRYGDPLPPGAIARLGTTRFRSDTTSLLLRFSPDGKTLTSVDSDALRVWDVATGKELRRGPKHPVEVHCAALSADGKVLALGAEYRMIHLRDALTGKEMRRITLDDSLGHLAAVALSLDGKILASRGWRDNSVVLWDVATGKKLHRLGKPTGGGSGFMVTSRHGLTFSPSDKYLAAGTENGVLLIWEVATGNELFRHSSKGRRIDPVTFSPDGKLLAWGEYDAIIHLCSVPDGKRLRQVKSFDGGVRYLAFSPDGRTLGSGEYDGTVRFWEVTTGKELCRSKEAPYMVSDVAFSPDGKTMAGELGSTICLWDVRTGQELRPPSGHLGPVFWIDLSPDGKTLATTGLSRETIRFWETATGKELSQKISGAFGRFSPDGKRLVYSDLDGKLRLRDLATGKDVPRLRLRERAWSAATASLGIPNSPSGALLSVVVSVQDVEEAETPLLSEAIGFSPDGKTLISYRGSTIILWDLQTGRELEHYDGPEPEPDGSDRRSIRFHAIPSPDGKTLAVIRREEQDEGIVDFVQLWAVMKRKEQGRFGIPDRHIVEGVFSADGKTLALVESTDSDLNIEARFYRTWKSRISLWEVTTGKERCHFSWSEGEINGLVFSVDGRTLASLTRDGIFVLWDVPTGKALYRSPEHLGRTASITFSRDGKTIAAGRWDSTILVWNAATLTGTARKSVVKLLPVELEKLWSDLAGEDAEKAYQGIWKLAAAPDQALPFLKARLKPFTPAAPAQIAQWIVDLDSPRFSVRAKATQELIRQGEFAEKSLREALTKKPTLEMRHRLEKLLQKVESFFTTPEELRALRCVEVLEHSDTPEAHQLLQMLAKGAPEARLTQAAQAALDRLVKRPLVP
jgi:WD40 repeat protein